MTLRVDYLPSVKLSQLARKYARKGDLPLGEAVMV